MVQNLTTTNGLQGLVIGVASTLLAALVVYIAKNWERIYKGLVYRIRRPPNIRVLEKILKDQGYRPGPKGSERNPLYWERSREQKRDYDPTYHFFIRGSQEYPAEDESATPFILEGFRGFLIPPLDFGHGRSGAEDKDEFRLLFNEDWRRYLNGIGYKAKEGMKQHKARAVAASNSRGAFFARRIVFFDRNMLRLAVKRAEWLFTEARWEEGAKRFTEGYEADPLVTLCRVLIRYAYDVAHIHILMRDHSNFIRCIYLDKALVASNQYRDFGWYKIEGIPVVYCPLYLKKSGRPIAKDRVLVGSRSRQRLHLQEYAKHFDDLWSKTGRARLHGADMSNLLTPDDHGEPDSFDNGAFSTEAFQMLYYNRLREVFAERGCELPSLRKDGTE